MRARVDPRTGAFVPVGRPLPPGYGPLAPASVRAIRARPFRGFGSDAPNPSGAQGPLIDAYFETDVFNPPPGVGAGSMAVVPNSTTPTPDPGTTGYLPTSVPFGESERPWSNPTTFATVPISAATNTSVPVLSQNFQRNALIIQNNSSFTVAGDVPPTLYVGFNSQPIVGFSLAILPLTGVAFDIITPRDSIYIAFGPFVNTGGSVVIRGAVIQGTYAP